jgi:hypothetical protein
MKGSLSTPTLSSPESTFATSTESSIQKRLGASSTVTSQESHKVIEIDGYDNRSKHELSATHSTFLEFLKQKTENAKTPKKRVKKLDKNEREEWTKQFDEVKLKALKQSGKLRSALEDRTPLCRPKIKREDINASVDSYSFCPQPKVNARQSQAGNSIFHSAPMIPTVVTVASGEQMIKSKKGILWFSV